MISLIVVLAVGVVIYAAVDFAVYRVFRALRSRLGL